MFKQTCWINYVIMLKIKLQKILLWLNNISFCVFNTMSPCLDVLIHQIELISGKLKLPVIKKSGTVLNKKSSHDGGLRGYQSPVVCVLLVNFSVAITVLA